MTIIICKCPAHWAFARFTPLITLIHIRHKVLTQKKRSHNYYGTVMAILVKLTQAVRVCLRYQKADLQNDRKTWFCYKHVLFCPIVLTFYYFVLVLLSHRLVWLQASTGSHHTWRSSPTRYPAACQTPAPPVCPPQLSARPVPPLSHWLVRTTTTCQPEVIKPTSAATMTTTAPSNSSVLFYIL